MADTKLPLGIIKQGCLKLESFIVDMQEVLEDEDFKDPNDRETITRITEMANTMEAALVNLVTQEIGEEEFISEKIQMDELGDFPEIERDILDEIIQ